MRSGDAPRRRGRRCRPRSRRRAVRAPRAVRSATRDSPRPHVFTERTRSGASVKRRDRRGVTSSAHMRRISDGTPGRRTQTDPSRSTHQPDADPIGLARISADGMRYAWRRLLSGKTPSPRHLVRSARSSSTSSVSGSPMASASPSRDRSSWVGPRPPVAMTRSTSARAAVKAAAMTVRSSGSARTPSNRTPSRARSAPRWAAFVSTVSPSRISLPMLSSWAVAIQPARSRSGSTISCTTRRSPSGPSAAGKMTMTCCAPASA